MEFNLPKDKSSIIKVIGVGGGGGNAVNHMYNLGIKGVDFIVCNTDHQALDGSPVPLKVQLGASLTDGRGAGSIPEIGKNAAIENIDDIRDLLEGSTKMVFVTAGMGGGTGTGAAPVIASVAKELGILTVGIVTMPFTFEGRKRREQATRGLDEMRANVDTLLVINNDRLRETYGNLSLGNAFAHADNVLTTAAKGIAEVISVTGAINVDFNDVNTVMRDSGVAIMGQAAAEGDNRAIDAVQTALSSPLLNDNDISGAQYVLLNITYGDKEVLMDEISEITDYIQDEAGSTADVIWGHGYDETLGDNLSVTIIATGFNTSPDMGEIREEKTKKFNLDNDQPKQVVNRVESPIGNAPEPVQNSTEEEAEEEPYLKSEETEDQRTFEFEVKSPFESSTSEEPQQNWSNTSDDGVKRYSLDDEYEPEATGETEPQASAPTTPVSETTQDEMAEQAWSASNASGNEQDSEEQQRLAKERMARIREISAKLKTPSGLSDLENEPAYMRRNVQLEDTPHSSESSVSKYTLGEEGEEGEKRTGLKDNNSFLHDNVD